MGKTAPSIEKVEYWFYEALEGAGRGLPYGQAWRAFSQVSLYHSRASKSYMRELREGIEHGRVKSVSCYHGPRGLLYGRTEDPTFAQAKADAEKPPPILTEPWIALGGRFNQSSNRVRWELCPVTSRMMQTMVVTVGIVDFMRCVECHRMHALGIRPDYADRRPHAWEVDPLLFREDYEDELSRRLCGEQESRISRVRAGGQYQGLMYRAVEWGNPEKWNEQMDRVRALRKRLNSRMFTAKTRTTTRKQSKKGR
jgi:hypothetical protein